MLLAWEMLSPHSSNQELHMAEEMWWRGTEKKKKKWALGDSHTVCPGVILSSPLYLLPKPPSLPLSVFLRCLLSLSHSLFPNLSSFVTSLPEAPFLFLRRLVLLRREGKKWRVAQEGQWVKGRMGEKELRSSTPPPARRTVKAMPETPLISKRGGREEKKKKKKLNLYSS